MRQEDRAMVEFDPISPELVLVDPEVRARALDELEQRERFNPPAFLAPGRTTPTHGLGAVDVGSNCSDEAAESERPLHLLLVAACLYFFMDAAQVALWGGALIAFLVAAITLAIVVV